MPNEIISHDTKTIEAALNRAKAQRSEAMANLVKAAYRSLFCRSDCGVEATIGNGRTSLAG